MDKLIQEIDEILAKSPNKTCFSEAELKSLILALSSDNRFDIFQNHCHRLGTSAHCFNDPNEFPNQILLRAKKTSAQIVMREIQNYLETNNVKIECGLLLYSIHLDSEFAFSNGVRLIKTSSLIDSNLISFLNKEANSTGGIDTALLVVDYVLPKKYYSSISSDERESDWSHLELKNNLIKKIDDTRLILSLSRNPSYGIPVVSSFEIIPDNFQFLKNGVGYSPYAEPRTGFGPIIIELEIRKSDELLKKFELLSNVDKERMRIAIKRLNDSKIDSNWANKSINLRICLENLFCGDSDVGLAQTISERAPTYTDFSKTRARKVYGFLSTAVHTGIPPEHQTITVQDITVEIHKAIIQFIENGGYPVWQTVNKKGKFQKIISCIKELFK